MPDEKKKGHALVKPFVAVWTIFAFLFVAAGELWHSIVDLDDYTPYKLLTPHKKDDIESVVKSAHQSSGRPQSSDSDEQHARRSSEKSYQFIDRGVSRAQGLLTFNSLVFAGVTLFLQLPLSIFDKIVLILATVPLGISTILSLLSTLVIWFDPKDHEDRKIEAPRIWKIWAYRALMFNVSVFLSSGSFVLLWLLIMFEVVIKG